MRKKIIIRRALFLMLALLLPLAVAAVEVEINGLWYNVDTSGSIAQVIKYKSSEYTGNISIPNSVTYSGKSYSVTYIGISAFDGCTSLTSIDIPNSVTYIGSSAFAGCTGLTSIDIPNSVTSIDDFAFQDCSGLTSVTIPNSVTSIGSATFSDCSGLTSVTIGNSVTYIGSSAFSGCTGLTSVTIGNSVTSIGDNAFRGCKGLTSVTIPNGVTSIGSYAFQGCSGLTSIDIPNSVTSIGSSAFYLCSGLTSITIPNSVTSIGYSAFYGCTSLTSVTIGNGVTSIDSSTFRGCSSLTSVTIPNSVTSIGWCSFDGCSGLTSITIPSSVTSIDGTAFYNCAGLTSITVASGNTKYDSRDNCNAIIETATNTLILGCQSTVIPNSVTSIGKSAFYGCSSLTSVTIPNSVTSFGIDVFYGCTGLTSITVASGNTKYDSRDNCNAIIETATNTLILGCQSTVIPNSVTSIGSVAFTGCTGLTSIDIPNNVTSIGSGAFESCSNLTSITIGNGVTSIPQYVNSGCSSLVDVYCLAEEPPVSIPANTNIFYEISKATLHVPLQSIDAYKKNRSWKGFGRIVAIVTSESVSGTCGDAVTWTYVESTRTLTIQGEGRMQDFNGSSVPWRYYDIKNVVINQGVSSIGNYAFSGYSGLTSIDIPNSVTSIGNYAFYDCSGLTKVIVPDLAAWCGIQFGNQYSNPLYYVKHLYSDENTEITELVIPNSVTSIGNYAFSGCSGLTSVTIPNSVTSIGNSAFYDCTGLTSIDIPNSVTSIGSYAFSGCTGLTSIDIPNSVTSIGDGAFGSCSGLTSVTIGNSVTSIGSDAFSGCTGLTTIDIPNSVTSIGNSAFRGCSGLTSITIGNSVTSIGNSAFSGCSGLTSVTIPNSVTSIGDGAFGSCSGLTSVTIGNSVTSIGSDAFSGSSGLTKVIASDIAAWCGIQFGNEFSNPLIWAGHLYSDENTEITEIVIPNTVTSISYTFRGCSGLTSVTIPNSVTSIGSYAFDICSGLTSVTIGNSVTSIGGAAFEGCTGLTTIDIPNSVTSIGNAAFSGCSGLTSITIGNSVTSIGNSAFYGCSGLTSVTIPNSVTSIGSYAFGNCSGLTSVTVNNYTPISIDRYTFSNRANATLYVPDGSKAAYQAARYWNEFKEIVEMPPGPPILFADANVKALCVANWDKNHDGELSETEAADVTNLGHVFQENTSISTFEELRYFTGLKTISENAFCYCRKLTSITIPCNVTEIGSSAFLGCKLSSLTIPKSVTVIGKGAFTDCGMTLTAINVESGNPKFDSRDDCHAIIETATNTLLWGCSNTVIPNGVTSIGNSAFSHCMDLTTITIPEGVTSIGSWAFYNCEKLTAVVIPDNVVSIGDDAFWHCDALASVTLGEGVTSIGATVFQDCNNLVSVTVKRKTPVDITEKVFTNRTNATLYVPYGSKTAYEAADYWKEFKEIIEIDTRLEQTLELAELPAMTYGDDTYELPATTAEGKTITWNSSDENVAAVSGNTVTVKGAGTVTITATQEGDDEYQPFTQTYELNIAKAQLTITADDCSMEQGSVLPTFTLSYEGFVNGEDETVLTTMPTATTTATPRSAVGTYPITVSGAEAKNYEITYVEGTLNVTEAAVVTDMSLLPNAVYVEPITTVAGTEVPMEVKLKNEGDVTSACFTVVLPEGMTLAEDEDGDLIYQLNGERIKTNKFAVYCTENESGFWNIRIMPTGTSTISGNEGTLLTLTVKTDDILEEGEHPVILKENSIKVKDGEGQQSTLELASTGAAVTIVSLMSGDVNLDREVDLMDAVMIVYASLGISQTGFIAKAADVNGDGRVDLTDAVIVVYKSLGVEPKSEMMARRADGEPVITESFIIDDVTIPAGKSIELPINFTADADSKIVGFQLNLNLPDGVTTVKDEDALPVFIKNETLCNKLTFYPTENDGFAALPQTTSAYVKGSEGTLFSVELKADESLTPGTKLTGTVTNAMFTVKDEDGSMRSVDVADFSFGISIVDKTTVGIDDISRESVNDGYYYNLNGQRVDVPRKGLYIKDGKKVRR